MRSKRMFVLVIIGVLALCLSMSQPANAASAEEEAFQVMTNWFKAFNTSDYELMSSLWWDSPKTSRFGPDNESAFLMKGIEPINEYWKLGLDIPPGASVNSLHHPQVTMIGNDVAIITGYNTQVYTDPTTKEQSISQVRGTFVVQKIGGKWLIVHEHSSVLPTE